MTPKETKIVGYVGLLILYLLVAMPHFGSPGILRMTLLYLAGATVAFWANPEPIGTLRPISFRPFYVLLGALMMIFSFVITLLIVSARNS